MSGKEAEFITNLEYVETDDDLEEIIYEGENEFETYVEYIKAGYNEIKSYLNFNSISIAEKLTVEDLLDLIVTYFN